MHKQEYVVTTATSGKRRRKHKIQAETPGLACRLAESQNPTGEAISVSTTWNIMGRCGKCNAVIFEGDNPRRRGNSLRCYEC